MGFLFQNALEEAKCLKGVRELLQYSKSGVLDSRIAGMIIEPIQACAYTYSERVWMSERESARERERARERESARARAREIARESEREREREQERGKERGGGREREREREQQGPILIEYFMAMPHRRRVEITTQARPSSETYAAWPLSSGYPSSSTRFRAAAVSN